MITALVSCATFAVGFVVARFVYRNTPEERAAFEKAWKEAGK